MFHPARPAGRSGKASRTRRHSVPKGHVAWPDSPRSPDRIASGCRTLRSAVGRPAWWPDRPRGCLWRPLAGSRPVSTTP
ncbi:MAG: hypothetical protein AVDCRST_MAG49-4086 [uncultured Thermomicrobiales bacterium]|uniref:Uncharacterized protein n=1 Tax=uncultured Thermomicrobiales bacterium TaxID=1645740 RepID=A0A6J4VCP3_9BACT|nr:MAG: hypothetical protein AVDCRST_MAG49-4086 [uncultured Thermomicrobiales bacterium]